MTESSRDVIIIGAGPAGIAAAIQLKRSGIDPLIFEKDAPGGLLRNANLVENYPGFPNGVVGPKLVELMTRHLRETGVELIHEEVLEADWSDAFVIGTAARAWNSKALIIATGTKPKPLPLPHPTGVVGKHLFYEVHSLLHLKSESIVILGAGDAAFDYALNLAGRGNQVTILHRGSDTTCLPLLRQRTERLDNIVFRPNVEVLRIEEAHSGLRLICRVESSEIKLNAVYVIAAFGREPYLNFITPQLKSQVEMLTARGILHIIGDVVNGSFRQAAIAAGDGIKAGMMIYKHLQRKDA
jgi:thioredoxin reductase